MRSVHADGWKGWGRGVGGEGWRQNSSFAGFGTQFPCLVYRGTAHFRLEVKSEKVPRWSDGMLPTVNHVRQLTVPILNTFQPVDTSFKLSLLFYSKTKWQHMPYLTNFNKYQNLSNSRQANMMKFEVYDAFNDPERLIKI